MTANSRYREKRGHYVAFSLAFSILVLSVVFLIVANQSSGEGELTAEKGVLDLSHVDLNEKKTIELNGEWQFFPNRFIGSYDEDLTGVNYVTVPSPWDLSSDEHGEARGFGTYRLLVKVNESRFYSVKTGTIRFSADIVLNGEKVASLGEPSSHAASYVPESKFLTGLIHSHGEEIEILIQVANFDYKQGGILTPILFGTSANIERLVNRERAFELLVTASFILISIFFASLYFRRGRSKSLLCFSLGSLSMGIYTATMNNQNLALLFEYGLRERSIIQTTTMLSTSLFFLLFVRYFFKDLVSKKICLAMSIFQSALMVTLVFIFLLSEGFPAMTRLQLLVVISVALSLGYSTLILLKAMKKKASSINYILVVAAGLIAYWVNMIAKILFNLKLTYYSDLIVLFVMIGMALLIGNRLHLEYVDATELTEERLEKEFRYFFSQISPHFFYNTLNTIIGLSYEEPEKTREALNYLAVYFRGKMDLHLQKGLIPLEDEIEMAMAYLEIEKMRYGDRLNLVYDIDESLSAKIPPLTLQPIAENAVRHGIVPKGTPGTVKITVKKADKGGVMIAISDDGEGMTPQKMHEIMKGESERLGLQNILDKINLMPNGSVQLISQPGQGLTVEIRVGGIHEKPCHESDYCRR